MALIPVTHSHCEQRPSFACQQYAEASCLPLLLPFLSMDTVLGSRLLYTNQRATWIFPVTELESLEVTVTCQTQRSLDGTPP